MSCRPTYYYIRLRKDPQFGIRRLLCQVLITTEDSGKSHIWNPSLTVSCRPTYYYIRLRQESEIETCIYIKNIYIYICSIHDLECCYKVHFDQVSLCNIKGVFYFNLLKTKKSKRASTDFISTKIKTLQTVR